MPSSSSKKKGKLFKNPFSSGKSASITSTSTHSRPSSSSINTPLTPHSDTSATNNAVNVASGSGTEKMKKPVKTRNQSTHSDPAKATPTNSSPALPASTPLASISTGSRTSSGLAYTGFCDSPFLCLPISCFFMPHSRVYRGPIGNGGRRSY